MQGKTTRVSGERVQITLADQVMIEEIKQNPELMKVYQDHTMVTRKNLPPQKDFVTYLKSQTSVAQLTKLVPIKKTTIEHWYRNDKCFSYPSPEDWEMIKPHLKEIKYDHEMTTLYPIEWTPTMYPTPRASTAMNANMSVLKKMKYKGRLEEKVAHTMYPTPSASCQMDVVAPPDSVSQNKSGWTVTRKNTKTKFGAKLNDVINKLDHEGMYPTPAQRDYKDTTVSKSYQNRNSDSLPIKMMKEQGHGGKLNPDFVEFLMGYPTKWTKVE
jgi:hypothetical protein